MAQLPNVLLILPFIVSAAITYRIERQCQWDLFGCDYPFSIEETIQFKCADDNDCPTEFMCCHHRCFTHKTCQPIVSQAASQQPPPPIENIQIKPGECDITLTCDVPLPRAFTKSFECFQDNDCPDHFKCCFIECYSHKVCQRSKNEHAIFSTTTHTSKTTSEEIPVISTTEYVTTNPTTELETTTETDSNEISTHPIEEITTTPTVTEVEESITLTVPVEIIMETTTNTHSFENTKITTLRETTWKNIENSTMVPDVTLTTTQNTTRTSTIEEHVTETTSIEKDNFEGSGDNVTDNDMNTVNLTTITIMSSTLSDAGISTEIIGTQTTEDFESSGDFGTTGDDEDEFVIFTTSESPYQDKVSTTISKMTEESNTDFQIIEDVDASTTKPTSLEKSSTLTVPVKETEETLKTTANSSQSTKITSSTEIMSNITEFSTEPSSTLVPKVTNITTTKSVTEAVIETTSIGTEDIEASGDNKIIDDDEDDLDTSTVIYNTNMSSISSDFTSTSRSSADTQGTEEYESDGDFTIIEHDEVHSVISTTTTNQAIRTIDQITEDLERIDDDEEDTTYTTLQHTITQTTNSKTDNLEVNDKDVDKSTTIRYSTSVDITLKNGTSTQSTEITPAKVTVTTIESSRSMVITTQNISSSEIITETVTEATNTEEDDYETSGDSEIINDDEDDFEYEDESTAIDNKTMSTILSDTTISSLRNDTKINQTQETDDVESSGDFEIIGDDEDERVISSTTEEDVVENVTEDSNLDLEIVDDNKEDTTKATLTTSVIQIPNTTIDNLKISSALPVPTEVIMESRTIINSTEVTSRAAEYSTGPSYITVPTQSTTTSKNITRTETPRTEPEDLESSGDNEITDDEDDVFTSGTTNDVLVPLDDSTTLSLHSNNKVINIDSTDDIESSGDRDEDDDEFYLLYDKMLTDKTIGNNNEMADANKFIRDVKFLSTPDSNSIDAYAYKTDSTDSTYDINSYYDDLYYDDFNEIIDD